MLWYILFLIEIASVSALPRNSNIICSPSSTQKNTSEILTSLRQEMRNAGIGVYVVFTNDEHGTLYTQLYDKRREWITGFRGSWGIAVITLQNAALWTDGRYFTQAEQELDCTNWFLMKEGNEGVPTVINWLVAEANQTELQPGSTLVFTSSSWWSSVNTALQSIRKQMKPVDDLVGKVWQKTKRPEESRQRIYPHDTKYTGENVTQKLVRTTNELKRLGATATIISALDEIAWQFNLRGADIPYNPFFKSYAIIYTDYNIRKPELFVHLSQINKIDHPVGVDVFDYPNFWSHLNVTANDPAIRKILVNPEASQAILSLIPDYKLRIPIVNSPIKSIKARKNPIERQGMRNCQKRDAIARMKHIGWIEQQLNNHRSVNESESVMQLLLYQKQQDKFQFPSFEAISASGDRAAIVHYSPEPATAQPITKNRVYLLDAGSQYLDCTTDITRTHHFGTPKDLEKRAYTRVLQGVLDIADAVFPTGTYGRLLDHLGRMHLYRDGMSFEHGIGHGIGHFLGVHEGPQSITSEYDEFDEPLADGVFISNEPGFYKPDDFGIRIEDDIEVVFANKSIYDKKQFLRFNTITVLPYERSLIDVSLLTNAQINAINEYHAKVEQILAPELKGDSAALNALYSRTKKLDRQTTTTAKTNFSNSNIINIGSPSLIIFTVIFMYIGLKI